MGLGSRATPSYTVLGRGLHHSCAVTVLYRHEAKVLRFVTTAVKSLLPPLAPGARDDVLADLPGARFGKPRQLLGDGPEALADATRRLVDVREDEEAHGVAGSPSPPTKLARSRPLGEVFYSEQVAGAWQEAAVHRTS